MKILETLRRWFGSSNPAPRAKTASQSAQSQRRGKPRLNARDGMRVLVVDDSATIVAVLRRMLEQNGYIVLEALDAEKGIEVANAELPDLIFLDIVLPGMSGFAALRQFRREGPTRDIPIIMMSGNEQATEQFYAQKIGADDFMKKPFSRSEVFARIEGLLDTTLLPKRLNMRGVDTSEPVPAPTSAS
ncbi:MAG: response regulator [Dokdonella sp.]|uniref:response regulator n=1 Tax=Dokdonella sp. TaxID=2291710 RepID=UPI003265B73F